MKPITTTLILAALATAGCQSAPERPVTLKRVDGSARVVMMPLDIQVAQMSSLGLMVPAARWTRDATRHVRDGVAGLFRERRIRMVKYSPPAGGKPQREMSQLARLHHAAARSVLRHRGGGRRALPARQKTAPWTLGKGATALAQRTGAHYALFLRVRDSYTSAGRAVQIAFMFVRTGFLMPGGQLRGYASLVELKTGNIVWLRTLSSESGDLRDATLAGNTMRALLRDFPR